jgi:hypothetical protein
VDAAREWVERYASERPELALLLEDGELQLQAGRVTMLWHRATDKRVGQLRRSEAVRSQACARG